MPATGYEPLSRAALMDHRGTLPLQDADDAKTDDPKDLAVPITPEKVAGKHHDPLIPSPFELTTLVIEYPFNCLLGSSPSFM